MARKEASTLTRYAGRIVVALLLAIVLYGAFAAWSDYEQLAASLSGFSWSAFAGACGLAIGNYVLRFLKWEYYLARLGIQGVPKHDSLLVFLSGFLLSITPAKVGEVFKSLLLRSLRDVPVARSAPIVVAERLTDTIGVTVLVVVGMRGLSVRGAVTGAAVGAGLVVGCLVVIMSRRLSEAVIRGCERLPGPFGRHAPKLRVAWESLRELTTPAALVVPSLLSVAAWALEGLALWVVVRGFGSTLSVLSSVFFYSTATLAGAAIPVPGGLGITESALHGQLQLLGGLTRPVAAGSMILVRFATLWLAVAIGLVALGVLRWRHPGLQEGVSDGAAEETGE